MIDISVIAEWSQVLNKNCINEDLLFRLDHMIDIFGVEILKVFTTDKMLGDGILGHILRNTTTTDTIPHIIYYFCYIWHARK